MAIAIRDLTPLLEVFDMPRSIAFYRDVLGFEVVETSESGDDFDWAMLRCGQAALMLNTAYEKDERPAGPDPGRLTGHADTELFCGCVDIHSAYAYLKASGCQVEAPIITHFGMRQLWVTDPDGFRICLHP